MELKMYSIRDAKASVYGPPLLKLTHGEAERDFTELTRDEKSYISKYPEDFDLFLLGTYENTTGKVIALDAPQHISKALDLIKG